MPKEKNPFTTAFEELSGTDLKGKEKTEKFKELARLKKGMSSDEPRSNVGDYDESKYSERRKKFINLARRKGLTSAEDVEKADTIKKEARKAAYKAAKEIGKTGLKTGLKAIPIIGPIVGALEPTELGAAERPLSDEQMSEINQMEEYGEKEDSFKKGGRVKKFKGGLIRGIPKIAMRGY